MKEEPRKCHLCDEPTVDKYCNNESCSEYKTDETDYLQSEINELYDKISKRVSNAYTMKLINKMTNLEIEIEQICNQ